MRIIRAAAPLLALGIVLAACSSSGGGATAAPTAAAPSAAAPSAAAPSAAAGGVTVNLADSTLGKILADGTGKTLYVFAQTQRPPASRSATATAPRTGRR